MTFGHTAGMTKQIAVKLPYGLVSEIDRLVEAGTFTSRSQAIRSGLETMVAMQHREVIDRRYRDAAARYPETQDEIAEVTDLAIKAIHEEPWEPWCEPRRRLVGRSTRRAGPTVSRGEPGRRQRGHATSPRRAHHQSRARDLPGRRGDARLLR